MSHIEFNPYSSESVIVTFICDECGNEVTSEEISVPSPDYAAETSHDSYNSSDGYAVCDKCKKEFEVAVWASFSGGYIDVSDIEDDNIIHVEEITEKLDEYYEQQIDAILFNVHSLETFNREIGSIKELNKISLADKAIEKTLKRQLLSGSITCLEDYLADKLITSVLNDEKLFRKFVRTFHGLRERKFQLNEILEKYDQLKDIVKKELLDVIYHDLPKVKGMFEDTFDIEFPPIGDVAKIVTQRHDMIHRNGKTKEGNEIEINEKIICEVIEKVESLVHDLDVRIDATYKKSKAS